MTQPDFNTLQDQIFARCRELTDTKGKDYSKGNIDMLRNFKENAEEFNMTSLQATGLYMKKHVDAIYNYIKTNGQSESEPIGERLSDLINYVCFLAALIEDGKQQVVSYTPTQPGILEVAPTFFYNAKKTSSTNL